MGAKIEFCGVYTWGFNSLLRFTSKNVRYSCKYFDDYFLEKVSDFYRLCVFCVKSIVGDDYKLSALLRVINEA